MAIAALVMLPFTLTLVVLVSWMAAGGRASLLIVLWLVLTVVATFWNAGWRARTAAEGGE